MNVHPFDAVWIRVIGELPARLRMYFGPSPTGQKAPSPSKWDLCPLIEKIQKESGVWSVGETVTMGCLVSFYRDDIGQEILASGRHANYVTALRRLEPTMRANVMEMLAVYPGW